MGTIYMITLSNNRMTGVVHYCINKLDLELGTPSPFKKQGCISHGGTY